MTINGEWFLGVQLRDFKDVFFKYNEHQNTSVAVAHLKEEYREKAMNIKDIRKIFTLLFGKLDGIRYDANPYSLLSSLFSCMRCARDEVEEATGTEDWLFCSELVAAVYRTLGIFDISVEPKNVVPMDFLGYEADEEGGIPVVVKEPIIII